MNGKTLSRDVQEILNEASTSGFIDDRTTYDYLYEAAVQFNLISQLNTDETTITTVDGTADYYLPYNFGSLYMKNQSGAYFLKLYDGTSYTWVLWKSYEEIYYENETTETKYPDSFTIVDHDQYANITGTTTADGAASNGECTLTDIVAPFANVTIGDYVSNITDGSSGYIIAVTSSSALVTALFDGTNNVWMLGDEYIITPKARMKIVLSPTPSTNGYIVSVPYVSMPDPVYSDYRKYRIPEQYRGALVKYAAWLYKYRDREPNYGDGFYKMFDQQARRAKADYNKTTLAKGFKVNFKRV
jgi:hypothetical protein